MGEIQVQVPGRETVYWPEYMSKHLMEVVRSWVALTECDAKP
jgi:hypothetical protein